MNRYDIDIIHYINIIFEKKFEMDTFFEIFLRNCLNSKIPKNEKFGSIFENFVISKKVSLLYTVVSYSNEGFSFK